MALHAHETGAQAQARLHVRPQYSLLGEIGDIPKLRMPITGMPPGTAYEIVHDELLLDGNERLNLATFVTTWMEPHAAKLMADCAAKNIIDKDEYPQTAEIERRCVNILGDPWHAAEATGRPDARRPAPARPACWEDWPSNGGGASAAWPPGCARTGPTW